MTQVTGTEIEVFPGEFYPDRCLSCYELHAENYGGTRLSRCAQCQHAEVCGCHFVLIKTFEKQTRASMAGS
ncbi:MAG: hypothetical protein V3V97_20985 [Hyphomicrobiaceae bacterium]